jgi:phage terminase large subunit-like protein
MADLARLTAEERREFLQLLELKAYERAGNKLKHYRPYVKQHTFHAAGKRHSERLFRAGNQLGKTVAGAAEWAMHATGRYPDDWPGLEFKKPTILWAGSVTGESTRDNPQRLLVGPPAVESDWGTGFLPRDSILGRDRAMGVANLLDNIQVKWGGGGDIQAGTSLIAFKAYEKGREKWQGPTVDGVWFDEEPPLEIYSEGLTRTNNGQNGQFAIITFTPLLGMSDVVMMFETPDVERL